MQKFKFILVILVLILATILVACTNQNDNSSGENGTGNFPESYDVSKPVFSDIGGIYDKAFTLKIRFPDKYAAKGYTIYYTLDGSEPTLTKATLYTSKGIRMPGKSYIESNGDFVTVVRAACYNAKGDMVGAISTATFIKPYGTAEDRYTMPVISLVTDSKNLNNKNTGIFTNWNQKGRDWERPVHVQFYEEDGSLAFSQDAGIRLFGGSSRGLPQKSLKINARKPSYFNSNKYDGTQEFLHEIFPGRKKANGEVLQVYNSFILRNAGNDSLIGGLVERATHLRDGWASRMGQIAAPNVDAMAYRPAVVYLNGDYYGILGIRENQDEDYIKNVYGIEDVENISIISSELDTSKGGRYDGLWFYFVQDNGPEGELENYRNIIIDINNKWISYRELREIFDIQNIIEFYAFNLLICNTDWPHNNVKLWKYVGENKEPDTVKDGKWRFMFKDQDLGLGRYTVAEDPANWPVELYTKADSKNFRFLLANFLKDLDFDGDHSGFPYIEWDKYPDSLGTQSLFNFCLKEEEFREEFRAYCLRLAVDVLSPEKMIAEIQKIYEVVEPEIVNHMYNRGTWSWQSPIDIKTWKSNVLGPDDSLVTFAKERSGKNGYFLKYMNEALSWYR